MLLIKHIIFQGVLFMTALGAALAQDNPFGVLEFLHWDHSWNANKYHTRAELDKAADAVLHCGAGIVRVDFLWQDIEPSPGKYDFAKYDRIVDALSSRGIEILGILDYSSDWASACGKWNCPPRDFALFAAYAARVADRYKGRVKYWEIWNEPDSAVYWQPQDRMKEYCRLLELSYKAIKEVDPGCKVLNGGLAKGLSSVNVLYDNGAAPYFDILNVHIFESPLSDGALSRIRAFPRLVRKVMTRNGDKDKKIWITETGCPGAADRSVKGWWLGRNPDEKEQAEWLVSVYAELTKAEGVEKVFWAFLRDCNRHWKNGTDYLGLLRWDFSEKPAFGAYSRASREWKENNGR